MGSRKLKIALIQLSVTEDREKNVERACKFITEAAKNGAKLVGLPECFNSPYDPKSIRTYAEEIPNGYTCKMLSKCAKENKIYIIGGTIPEIENSIYYNACTIWNPNGELIGKYRKMHLFDLDIPGKLTFKESDVMTPGKDIVTFDVENNVRIGLGVCHDIRFEELAKTYRLKGCDILFYPNAFDKVTGEPDFELLQRSRALDNQVFVVSISPAVDTVGYLKWGHSQVTSPWGKVLLQAGEKEELLYYEIDLNECDQVRQQIPIFSQRRTDVYNTSLVE